MSNELERLAVLEDRLRRSEHDINAISASNRRRIDELETELSALKNEVMRYKWIVNGIAMALSAIAYLITNTVDFFKK